MVKLRPYQERDYGNIIEEFKKHNSVLYQASTGSGKSVVIEHFVLNHKKEQILILAHKRELVFQMKKRLEASGLKVGIIIGNIEENINSNIIIASIRTVTLEKRIGTLLSRKFDKVIIDEAHHIRTNSYENVLDQLKANNSSEKLLGVTATPYRSDKKELKKYFDTLVCSDDIQTLQNDGYLAKYKVYYTPTKNIDEEVESNNSDYQIQSLSNYMRKPEMLQFLVDSYIKYGENKQMIVFCVDKKHAKEVQEQYKINGFKNISHIDSDTDLKDRASILTAFSQQKIQIITCIETLTEGVDLPETKVIQLARPTQSLILYLQMVGRGSRPKSDGLECIILDNSGCSLEHKLPNSPRHWSLNPEINPTNPGKKNRIIGKRKDGTYTEDESEMDFLELVEMTPEEYIANVDGGIEKAENDNKEADNRCKQILKQIADFVLSKIKDKGYIFDSDLKGDYFSKDEISIKNKIHNNNLSIKYNKRKNIILECNDWWHPEDKEDALKKLYNNSIEGQLASELMKEKNYDYLLNLFGEIAEIQSLKTDISELQNKAKEFQKEQLKTKISIYLNSNTEIELPEEIYLSRYFRTSWSYSYGRSNNKVKTLKFAKNKLRSSNDISFLDKDKKVIETKSQIKPEKVIEILEDSGWGTK